MTEAYNSDRATTTDVAIVLVGVLLMKTLGLRAAFLAVAVVSLGAGLYFGKGETPGRLIKARSLCSMVAVLFVLLALMQGIWAYLFFPVIAFASVWVGLYARSVTTPGEVARLGIFMVAWLGATAGMAYVGLPAVAERSLTRSEFEAMPAFTLQTLDGTPFGSDELNGKVVVLDFWASWCAPCLAQFPELESVYEKYQSHPDVDIIAVNTSWDNTKTAAKAFVERRGLKVPVLYDTGGALTNQLGISTIPHTLIMDKQGYIRVRHAGFIPGGGYFEDMIGRQIEELLAE